MIRVEITLDPGGLGHRQRRIGYVEIVNDGAAGSGARGNYDVRVFAKTATALIAEAFKQAYPENGYPLRWPV